MALGDSDLHGLYGRQPDSKKSLAIIRAVKISHLMSSFLVLSSVALALPGQSVAPSAAGVAVTRLRGDESDKLVLIKARQITEVAEFTSKSGKKHLKFNFVSGSQYPAIAFEGNWSAADQAILKQGKADIYGVWGTFNNAPSLTVYRIKSSQAAVQAVASTVTASKLLMIRDAKVNSATVDQFTSGAQKTHVTFHFTVNGKDYQGIVYDNYRKSNTSEILRSGRVTLYGTWTTYKGGPSFVVQRVER